MSAKAVAYASVCCLLVTACVSSSGTTGPVGQKGADGLPGDPGAAAPTGDAGVIGVFPAEGFLDRTASFSVALTSMPVDAQTKLDFGMGITVSDVTLTDANTLRATLKIDATAALGPR